MHEYGDFYSEIIQHLVNSGTLSPDDAVLVVCGAQCDIDVLRACGLRNVVITNLDSFGLDFGQFKYATENAERLSFPDQSFDWVIEHAGLHHCHSPHAALLEMCRVSRKAAVAIEARDSALMRLAIRLGLTGHYEIEDIARMGHGGVSDTAVPNFVYRWTEREVRKTIASAYPHRENVIRFHYGLRLPDSFKTGGLMRRMAGALLTPALAVVRKILPRQCNEFAFIVYNSTTYKPWIAVGDKGLGLRREFPIAHARSI